MLHKISIVILNAVVLIIGSGEIKSLIRPFIEHDIYRSLFRSLLLLAVFCSYLNLNLFVLIEG